MWKSKIWLVPPFNRSTPVCIGVYNGEFVIHLTKFHTDPIRGFVIPEILSHDSHNFITRQVAVCNCACCKLQLSCINNNWPFTTFSQQSCIEQSTASAYNGASEQARIKDDAYTSSSSPGGCTGATFCDIVSHSMSVWILMHKRARICLLFD